MGGAQFPYWYIPILFFLYVCTPVLELILRSQYARYFVMVVGLLPLVFSRSWPDFSVNNYIYFLGVYVVGLWFGANYKFALAWVIKHKTAFLLIAVLSSVALFGMFERDLDKLGFVSVRESLFYVQKLAFAGFVLVWFKQKLEVIPAWLNLFAHYAFSIFFLHTAVLFLLYYTLAKVAGGIPLTEVTFFYGVMALGVSLWGSCLVVFLVKKILGSNARCLIGS